MNSPEEYNVFMSYKHDDEVLVKPIVSLLRLKPGNVFFDKDSIKPGSDWKSTIKQSIKGCDTFVLFWCQHAKLSKEVKFEYEMALRMKKPIVPLKIDDSELPESLRKFQWIDLTPWRLHDNYKLLDGFKLLNNSELPARPAELPIYRSDVEIEPKILDELSFKELIVSITRQIIHSAAKQSSTSTNLNFKRKLVSSSKSEGSVENDWEQVLNDYGALILTLLAILIIFYFIPILRFFLNIF